MESNQPTTDSELNESLTIQKEKFNEGAKKQAEIQEKVDNVLFIVSHTSADKKLKKIHKKKLEIYKKIKMIDLTKSLNGKKYSTTAKFKIQK